MPLNLDVDPGKPRKITAPLDRVEVQIGHLFVADHEEHTEEAKAGGTIDGHKLRPPMTLYARGAAARCRIVYDSEAGTHPS